MQRVVISDASPLHYLILIGHAEVLPSLYTEVLIPEAVAKELQHHASPEVFTKGGDGLENVKPSQAIWLLQPKFFARTGIPSENLLKKHPEPAMPRR